MALGEAYESEADARRAAAALIRGVYCPARSLTLNCHEGGKTTLTFGELCAQYMSMSKLAVESS